MTRLHAHQRRPVRTQHVDSFRQPARRDQVSVFRDLQPIRGALQRLENHSLVGQIASLGRVVDVEGVDRAFARRGEEDVDGVVVEVALAFGRHGADALEARVGDVEGLAGGGEGDAVGMIEGVFDDGDGAGGGAKAVCSEGVGGGAAAEFEAVAVVCGRR